MTWTDERCFQLRELAAKGWSAAQISEALGGITRNSVIGKAHRMGFTLSGIRKGDPSPPKRIVVHFSEQEDKDLRTMWQAGMSVRMIADRLGRLKQSISHRAKVLDLPNRIKGWHEANANAKSALRKTFESKVPVPATGSIPFEQLNIGGCRFPYGEEPPYVFCSNRALEGSSYCAGHFRSCTDQSWSRSGGRLGPQASFTPSPLRAKAGTGP
jgi:GcrA cell cycle regulator